MLKHYVARSEASIEKVTPLPVPCSIHIGVLLCLSRLSHSNLSHMLIFSKNLFQILHFPIPKPTIHGLPQPSSPPFTLLFFLFFPSQVPMQHPSSRTKTFSSQTFFSCQIYCGCGWPCFIFFWLRWGHLRFHLLSEAQSAGEWCPFTASYDCDFRYGYVSYAWVEHGISAECCFWAE